MDSQLAALIKKQIKPRLVLSTLLVILTLTLFFYYRSYIQAKTIGADRVTTADGIMEHFERGSPYVSVHADSLFIEDLIVETSSTENGRNVSTKKTAFFVSAYIENKLLIIELPYSLYEDESFSFDDVTLTGKLKASTSDFDVIGEIADNISSEINIPRSMVIEELLIPVYLDTTGDSTAAALTIIGFVVFAAAFFILVKNVIRLTNPKTHRIYRQIRATGDAAVEAMIEREIADNSSYLIARTSTYDYLTTNFILSLVRGKLTLGKTENVVWAYRRDIKNRGVTTHFIVLRMKDGESRRTLRAASPDIAEQAMESIYNNLPVLCGYSAQLDALYSKNQPEFQSLLEERRAEFDGV